MTVSLRIPRVEVFWGSTNLTFYTEGGESDPLYGQPLVYNVTVSLTESGQNPNGSMMWNPTGAAYKIYEKFVSEKTGETITVRYYYIDGRSITFVFVWSGQQENYGQSMDLKVMLSSELDGLTNGILRCTAQADEEGYSMTEAVREIEKFFGVDTFNLVDYTDKAKKDMEKTKVQSNYNPSMKFYDAVVSIAENNGNLVFPINVVPPSGGTQGAPKLIVFTPYGWDKEATVEELSPTEQFPNPKTRYGYFLGPCLIETISKQSQWQPPQKTQTLSINTQQKLTNQSTQTTPSQGAPASSGAARAAAAAAGATRTGGSAGATTGTASGGQGRSPASGNTGTPAGTIPPRGEAQAAAQAASKPGATGTSHSVARSRMRLADNEHGEEKKLILQKERQCRLSTTLFMAPVFTGLKPYDVLFVPNYSGTFMEDWIVNSVEYTQTDGGVNLSVQASRHFGLSVYMNEKQGKAWLDKAKGYGLVGEGATLENWMNYGWKPGTTPSPGSTSISGGAAPVGPVPLTVAPYGTSGFTLGESSSIA